jgi:uncharacterized protein
MQTPTESPAPTFQQQFHHRWNHLNDPHVRTLAWLLDAPDLLDPAAPQWQGRIATLGKIGADTQDWLTALDRTPGELHAWLDVQPFTRLGRYAEKLLAFHLKHQGTLVAHGVQVRDGRNGTVGEFDFLVKEGDALVHWEFATKLYLLESSGQGRHADYFVGPDLSDTLGAKLRKIMDRQLFLSQHPAARPLLPQPVVRAEALVKGWLFYHGHTSLLPQGVSPAHCRGSWCVFEELVPAGDAHYQVLPRLSWLAPAKAAPAQTLRFAQLEESLRQHFADTASPVLVATLVPHDGFMLETDRGFVVPNDWHDRAEVRVSQA